MCDDVPPVFDRDGHHVRTFGRTGKGPGEFQDAVGLGRHPRPVFRAPLRVLPRQTGM